jgi:hypothetical protein
VSPKSIAAFNMTVVMKHGDGTQDVGEAGADFSTGIGSLASERSFDTRLYSAKAVTNVEAVIDVIVYTDGTSEVQNKRAYDRIVTQRKNSQNGRAKNEFNAGFSIFQRTILSKSHSGSSKGASERASLAGTI